MKFWFKIIKDADGILTLLGLSFVIITMGLLSPLFIIQIFNRYITFGLEGTLFFLITGALIVAIIEYIFRNLRHSFCARIIVHPIKQLKLTISNFYFYNSNNNNKNNNIIDLIDLKNNVFQTLNPINQSNVLDFLFAVMILIILFVLNVKLAFIFLIFFMLIFLIQVLILRFKLQRSLNRKDDLIFFSDLTFKSEYLKILNNFKFIGGNLSLIVKNQLDSLKQIAITSSNHINFNHFIIILNSVLIIGAGSYFVVQGDLDIGTLIGFNIFSSRALQISINAQNSYYNFEKISKYFDFTSNFLKSYDKKKNFIKLNNDRFIINLDNLKPRDASESPNLIKNFSMVANPGEITNISGPNSSGKTLLCKLILGLESSYGGEIKINNFDLEKLSLTWWRSIIGYVPQNQLCLNTSIIDNIVINNEKISEEKILNNLKVYGFTKMLRNANLSINSKLSSNISPGIHKRIHYARVLMADKKIILIDDPFENLDSEGKSHVMKYLNLFKNQKKTVICFSNEEEIIKFSDQRYEVYE